MECRPTDLLRHVTAAREARDAREQALNDEPFHTAPAAREDERGAGPGESDPPDPPDPTPDLPERHAPTRPPRGTLIPDWREGPQADLSADVDEDQAEDDVPQAPAADRDDHDDEPEEAEPQKDKPEKKGRAKRAPKTTPAKKAPAEDEPEEDDEAEEDNEPGEEQPARRTYRRPQYREAPFNPRQSGLQWWRGLKTRERAGTYVITAFGAGVMLQLPQFVSRQTVYLVRSYQGFDPNHVVWGSVVVGAVWLCWRTRHMWPLFAWAGCIPLVSLCSGLLLYGPPVRALDRLRDLVLYLV